MGDWSSSWVVLEWAAVALLVALVLPYLQPSRRRHRGGTARLVLALAVGLALAAAGASTSAMDAPQRLLHLGAILALVCGLVGLAGLRAVRPAPARAAGRRSVDPARRAPGGRRHGRRPGVPAAGRARRPAPGHHLRGAHRGRRPRAPVDHRQPLRRAVAPARPHARAGRLDRDRQPQRPHRRDRLALDAAHHQATATRSSCRTASWSRASVLNLSRPTGAHRARCG